MGSRRLPFDFCGVQFFLPKNIAAKLKFSSTLKFSPPLLKFRSSLFKGLRCQERVALVALRRARKLFSALFFLIAFSFAPAYAKEKAGWSRYFFVLAVGGAWVLTFYFRVTFLLSYFCVTKSTKSHIRERSSLLYISARVHELVARAMRGKCVRHMVKRKSIAFAALRNLNHTTRANISHEKVEQIRARIVCTPAESAWRA